MVKENKNKFPIKGGLMWFFYIVGWFFAVFNMFFWLVELIAAILSEDKHKFIDVTFHKIVYIWGVISVVLFILVIFLMILGFNLLFMPMFH